MIHSLPEYMREHILSGIVELDPNDEDDMLPAFFAYRMRKIPGTFFLIISLIDIFGHLLKKFLLSRG